MRNPHRFPFPKIFVDNCLFSQTALNFAIWKFCWCPMYEYKWFRCRAGVSSMLVMLVSCLLSLLTSLSQPRLSIWPSCPSYSRWGACWWWRAASSLSSPPSPNPGSPSGRPVHPTVGEEHVGDDGELPPLPPHLPLPTQALHLALLSFPH